MGNFWVKMGIFAIVVIVLIVLVKNFSDSAPPKEEPKTVYDTWEEDDKRLRAAPPGVIAPAGKTVQTPPPGRNNPTQPLQTPTPVATSQPSTVPATQPAARQFKQLSEIDKIEAERLFEVALSGRKLGRLPATGYKLMVETCRQIISKYPGTVYEYKAKRLLVEIPQRYRKRYNITAEEIDLSK